MPINNIKRALAISLTIISAGIMASCGPAKPASLTSVVSEDASLTSSAPVSYASFPQATARKSWDELHAQNKDIVGWLTIPGTKTNNAVLEYSDNDYYLHRNLQQQTDVNGSLFVDYRDNVKTMPMSQNIVIYGHDMKSGLMFGQLIKYKDISFAKQQPLINFDTLASNGQYKILSCFIINTLDSQGPVFDYREPDFPNQVAFLNYANILKQRSLFNFPTDVQANDTLLTMSTCTYEMDNCRFVVVARKLREGESAVVDAKSIVKNPNPLYFDGWYKKFGGKAPAAPTPLTSLPATSSEATSGVATTSAASTKSTSSVANSK